MSSSSTAAGRRPRGLTLALDAVLATTALAAVPSAASAWTASPGMGAGFIFVTDAAGVDNDFVVQQAGSKVTIRDLNGDPVTNWVTYCTVVSVDTLECDPGSGTVPPALNFTLGGGNDRLDASGYVSAVNVAPGAGADWVLGGDAADAIAGGDGDDTLDGAGGNDRIEGGAVDFAPGSVLRGSIGNDSLFGGAETDLLDGGAGDDLLDGRGAADDLLCGDDLDSYRTDGLDTVAGDCELLIP